MLICSVAKVHSSLTFSLFGARLKEDFTWDTEKPLHVVTNITQGNKENLSLSLPNGLSWKKYSQWRYFSEYLEVLRGGFLSWRTLIGGPHLHHVYSCRRVYCIYTNFTVKGTKRYLQELNKGCPGLCDLSEFRLFCCNTAVMVIH